MALMSMGRAMAVIDGRDYVIPDDIKRVIIETLGHRIVLKPEVAWRGGLVVRILLGSMLRRYQYPGSDY